MAAMGKVIWCFADTLVIPLLRFLGFFTSSTIK